MMRNRPTEKDGASFKYRRLTKAATKVATVTTLVVLRRWMSDFMGSKILSGQTLKPMVIMSNQVSGQISSNQVVPAHIAAAIWLHVRAVTKNEYNADFASAGSAAVEVPVVSVFVHSSVLHTPDPPASASVAVPVKITRVTAITMATTAAAAIDVSAVTAVASAATVAVAAVIDVFAAVAATIAATSTVTAAAAAASAAAATAAVVAIDVSVATAAAATSVIIAAATVASTGAATAAVAQLSQRYTHLLIFL